MSTTNDHDSDSSERAGAPSSGEDVERSEGPSPVTWHADSREKYDELVLSHDEPQATPSALEHDLPPGSRPPTSAKHVVSTGARGTRPRRVRLPLVLFLTTCVSTFWVGANHWMPLPTYGSVRQILLAHWYDGLVYMCCVLAILIAHEMGHFLATVRYGISASLPYFIPFPISPIGTMGAVIGMDGLKADRKELFDIGLAGPLAGLVVAVPIMWLGIAKLDLDTMGYGPFALDLPLLARIGLRQLGPPGYAAESSIWFSHLNPYFMAGWVGCLITGLNMIPVSQLDGGHVVYTLFGRKAHWIARGLVVLAIVMVAVFGQWRWSPMILLVLFIGPDHPPTRDDNVPLGWLRVALGCAAILIPLLCFPLRLIIVPGS